MDAGTRNWLHPHEDGFDVPPTRINHDPNTRRNFSKKATIPRTQKDPLRAYGQWADYSIINPAESRVFVVDPEIDDIRQYIGLIGPSGWTSYFGVLDVGNQNQVRLPCFRRWVHRVNHWSGRPNSWLSNNRNRWQ